jgi:L-fucose isomerase-like protein
VTLARLCRRNREYWMAIVPGEVVAAAPEILQNVTPAFPKAVVRSAAGDDFLNEFSSNHIHMSSGDLTGELVAFCELAGIPWKLWK